MASEKWEEYSVIGDKGEVGFIDFADDQSVTSYNPNEEGAVVVSVPFPFVSGKPQSVLVGETAADTITITNTTEEEMELWGMSIYASSPENSFRLSLMKPPPGEPDDVPSKDSDPYSLEDRILRPRQTLTVWLSCLPKEIGVYTSIVNIDVGDNRIERVVFLLAEDRISKALASDKPYSRRRKNNIPFATDSYVKGIRPGNTMKRNYKHRLPMYPISAEDRELFMGDQMPEPLMSGLTRNNYATFFRTLLIMEELQLEEDMKTYDMESVSMKRRGPQFLSLEVPGLAERRPSLVHGDAIYVKLANADPEKSAFEGYIHRVEADEIYLQFADNFHQLHSDDNLYNVHFAYNRVNFRRLYHAIEAAHAMRANYLFPSAFAGRRRIRPSRTVPISPALNNEQCSAVGLILGCKGGAPYVIHGPPGTGKTKTLVEIILQLYRTRPKSCILVCASSNCAADHILEQIVGAEKKSVKLKDNEIFRLNAASRPYEEIGPDYMKFCFFEDLVFKCPPLEALRCYRIVITTYMSASLLVAEGLKQGHFSHIILDEAGQASEPETMVPIANLSHNDTVIVLAGDPKQLGPVIQSKEAECYGLGKSYLERLFENDLYSNGDENYVTVLVRNYRCHPEILSLPSKMFYNDMLIAAREVAAYFPWDDLLKNKNFPVLFCGVQGLDEREGSNPSWFNRIEASKVVEIIKKLVEWNVDEHDIGVITPYRQQVAKIRKALEGLDMANIKIGSVEQFQGQEREVIIVSTVRSTIKHDNFDRIFCLGFLSNPKRFNVAMTRARSLLVIVGNPHIVSKDPCWEQLLWHCADNNSYQGCGLPEKLSYSSDMGPMTEGWGPDGNTASKMGDWGVDDTASKIGDWGLNNTVDTGIGDEVPDKKVAFTAGGRDSDKEEGSIKQSKELAGSRGEWFPLGDLPEPVKDEDQWSDGWK